MTLSARLEDMEVTLEHMLMDVFVSLPTLNYPSLLFSATIIIFSFLHRLNLSFIATHDCSSEPGANICSHLFPDVLSLIGNKTKVQIECQDLHTRDEDFDVNRLLYTTNLTLRYN